MLKYFIGALGALLMLGALYFFAVEIGKSVQITSYKLVPWVFPVGALLLASVTVILSVSLKGVDFAHGKLPLVVWIFLGMTFIAVARSIQKVVFGIDDGYVPLVPSQQFAGELGTFTGFLVSGAVGGVIGWTIIKRSQKPWE